MSAAIREVMDIHQAAEYLGISTDTLYRYASAGTVPAFRLGNMWRFKRSFIDAWMAEKCYPTGPKKKKVVSISTKRKKG